MTCHNNMFSEENVPKACNSKATVSQTNVCQERVSQHQMSQGHVSQKVCVSHQCWESRYELGDSLPYHSLMTSGNFVKIVKC